MTADQVALLKEKFICVPHVWGMEEYVKEQEFLHRVWESHPAFLHDKFGWHFMAATGKVLHEKEVRETGIKGLERILAAFSQLPESEKKPRLGDDDLKGAHRPTEWAARPRPPRALTLRIFARPLKRDARGQYALANYTAVTNTFEGEPHSDAPEPPDPTQDLFWITEDEWKSLVPADVKRGVRRSLPDRLRQRILRFGLAPNHAYYGGLIEWTNIRSSEMTLTTEDVSAAQVCLRLEGSALLSWPEAFCASDSRLAAEAHYDVRFYGLLTYDRTKSTFTRFDLAAAGDYWGPWFHRIRPERTPFGFSMELADGSWAWDRSGTPVALMHLHPSEGEKYYRP